MRGALRIAAVLAAAGTAGALPSAARAQGACDVWVEPPPLGNDANPGTQVLPWARLDHASAKLLALGASGSTVCFLNGFYNGGNSL